MTVYARLQSQNTLQAEESVAGLVSLSLYFKPYLLSEDVWVRPADPHYLESLLTVSVSQVQNSRSDQSEALFWPLWTLGMHMVHQT